MTLNYGYLGSQGRSPRELLCDVAKRLQLRKHLHLSIITGSVVVHFECCFLGFDSIGFGVPLRIALAWCRRFQHEFNVAWQQHERARTACVCVWDIASACTMQQ